MSSTASNFFFLSPRLILAFTVTIVIAGCAAGSGDAPQLGLNAPDQSHLSPTERELRAQVRQERQLESAAVGCIVVGVGSGLIPLLTGDTRQALANATVGCIGGGAIGLAYGSYVDARAQAYANEQEQVARMTVAAQEDVIRYKRINLTTQKLIDEQKRLIAQISQNQGNAMQTAADRERRNTANAETIRDLEKQLEEMDGNVKTIEADIPTLAAKGINTAALESQKKALVAQKSQLSKKVAVFKSIAVKPA